MSRYKSFVIDKLFLIEEKEDGGCICKLHWKFGTERNFHGFYD